MEVGFFKYCDWHYDKVLLATYNGLDDYMQSGQRMLATKTAVMKRAKADLDESSPAFCRFCGGSYADCQSRKLPESLNLSEFTSGISANLSESQQDTDFAYDVSGLSYDCGMYASGRPDIWLNPAGDGKPAINLYICNSFPYTLKAAAIEKEAQAKLAMALHLLKSEYRLNLYYVNGAQCHRTQKHKTTQTEYTEYLEVTDLGPMQDIPTETFVFAFGTTLLYRAESVRIHSCYWCNRDNGGHVDTNTRKVEGYLRQRDFDGCNVVLPPNMDYAPEKVDKWLSENEIEAGKTLVYKEY